MAQAAVRNSPLWKSDPKQQLAYLAIKKWARLFTPDVILGVYTPDEMDVTPESGDAEIEHVNVATSAGGKAEPAELSPPALQDCTEEAFATFFEKYSTPIAEGKTTAEHIVYNIKTRVNLSESQEEAFFDLQPPLNQEA